jgi:hypothetical protein
MSDNIPGLRPNRWHYHLTLALVATLPVLALGLIIFLVTPSPESKARGKTAITSEKPRTACQAHEGGIPVAVMHHVPIGMESVFVIAGLRATAIYTTMKHDGPEPYFSFGSGAVIADGIVLTAAHVIPEDGVSTSVSCMTSNGFHHTSARPILLDRVRDVGILDASACVAPKITVAAAPPEHTEVLVTVGFQFEHDACGKWIATAQFLTTSLVPLVGVKDSRDRSDPDVQRMIDLWDETGILHPYAVSGALIKGKSGSPVLTRDGTLIGVAVLSNFALNRSFIVRPENIMHVLQEAGL